MRKIWVLALLFMAWTAALCEAQNRYDAEAIRLNNRGVAQMGQQFTERAADSFTQAFKMDPLHASAEFGLARALQRTGRTADAKAHFARFQHLTGTKISSALGLSYG